MQTSVRPRKNRHLPLVMLVVVLVAAVTWLVLIEWKTVISRPETPASSAVGAPDAVVTVGRTTPAAESVVVAPGPTPVRAFGAKPTPPVEGLANERSPLADDLHAPDSDPRVDLAIIHNLFTHFLGEMREMPVGNNAEITAALAGDNDRAYAVLPADHAAISPTGELVDRWGTSYFFHQLSAEMMEIQSAGPDRRRDTIDDLVWPKPELIASDPRELAGTETDSPSP